MKKYSKAIVVFVVMFMASFAASAQIYVKIRPAHTVVARPEPPRQHVVWVGEDWVVRNGRYEYNGDRWVDERNGYIWVPGHWKKHGRNGERWVPGRWRKA